MTSRIGKIIKRYRKEKGYTQFQMAEKIGVSDISPLWRLGAENRGEKP